MMVKARNVWKDGRVKKKRTGRMEGCTSIMDIGIAKQKTEMHSKELRGAQAKWT